MSEEERVEVETATAGEPIDLDTDAASELDAAMRDALEAVEAGTESQKGIELASESVESAADADLETQVAEQRERALRALADLENYRKRVQRERLEESRFKAFEPMRDFLAVVDNLERALASDGSVDDLKAGVEMILRQMGNLLRDHGVERVEAVGQAFDPSVHEAVSREENPDVQIPMVSQEMQAGYTMHGRLLRPSVVRVSMPADPGGAGNKDDA